MSKHRLVLSGLITQDSRLKTQNSLLSRLPVRARSRAAHEHFPAIKVFHKNADAFTLSALGLIREDFDLRSDRQARFRDAIPEEIGRGATLDSPIGHLAVGIFDIDPEPGMGIDQFHFCDCTLQVDRLFLIKSRRECVMPCSWYRNQK